MHDKASNNDCDDTCLVCKAEHLLSVEGQLHWNQIKRYILCQLLEQSLIWF